MNELFIVKVFKNDRSNAFVNRIGSGFKNQMTATRVAEDLNGTFAVLGVNCYAEVVAEETF